MIIEIPNTDLTTVETGIPILEAGVYEVKVTKVEVRPSRDGKSENLHIQLALEQHATSLAGETVNPGFPLFARISLKATEKYNPGRHLAALMDCFLPERTAKFDTEALIGQTGNVKLSVRNDDQFGTSNEVQKWEKRS